MKWQIHIIMDLCSSLASSLPSLKPQLLTVIRRGFASPSQVVLPAATAALPVYPCAGRPCALTVRPAVQCVHGWLLHVHLG